MLERLWEWWNGSVTRNCKLHDITECDISKYDVNPRDRDSCIIPDPDLRIPHSQVANGWRRIGPYRYFPQIRPGVIYALIRNIVFINFSTQGNKYAQSTVEPVNGDSSITSWLNDEERYSCWYSLPMISQMLFHKINSMTIKCDITNTNLDTYTGFQIIK